MEVIRGELAALRTQSNMAAVRSQSMPRALNRLSVEPVSYTHLDVYKRQSVPKCNCVY